MNTFAKRILTLVMSIVMVFSLALPAYAATGVTPSDTDIVVPLPGPGDYLSSQTQAAVLLRSGLKAREESISIKIMTTRTDLDAFTEEIYEMAVAHTGQPTEGDYLRWQIGGYEASYNGTQSGAYAKLTLTYVPTYYTTAAQEAEVDRSVEALLDQMNLDGKSDYVKIKTVYDAICSQVKYDNEGLAAGNKLVYTAYDAIVNGKAVCQGYSVLFYRAMLELNVDVRVVTGTSENQPHAWNIVKLGDKYYNVDSTWDAALVQADRDCEYFLKSDASFDGHTRDEEYASETFYAAYPMAEEDFTVGGGSDLLRSGDTDANGIVDVDDVVALLLHVSMPDMFEVDPNVLTDYTVDGVVDVDDVVALLLHVSMPDMFPLYADEQ